ncbi:MAG: DUF2226 domain-containing protein [Candidatus ainarchaeum sp.]|jgi:hypothetical protein|nr:DUF2226 domain-containing protein [Candidatus ainarchaeum sp.]
MNLPISKPIVENVFLDVIDPVKLLSDLNQKQFTGFIYLTVHSLNNFEENILLFLKGNISGSIYLNNTYNVEIFGKEAFDFSINNLGYNDGIINIYELSAEQLKLILIFNDKIKYETKIDEKSILKLNFKYNENLFRERLKNKILNVKLREELFDKFKINELLRL